MARSHELPALFTRTEAPANGELADDQAAAAVASGRGGLRKTRPRRVRGLPAGEKPRSVKLTIPASVFERLEQTARKRSKTMSELAGEILNRALPYVKITFIDTPPAPDAE